MIALMLMPERSCAKCTRQQEWGCHAREVLRDDGSIGWQGGAWLPIEIDEEEVVRCPRRPIKDDPEGWERLLLYHGMFQKGFLPDAGAVVDQSAKGMMILRLVDATVAECLRQEEERRRRQEAGPPRR